MNRIGTEIEQRAIGAFIGAAVGDALGAGFEFQPEGTYSRRFPQPVLGGIGEMIGGGGFNWEPGEFTDDTQMAVVLAESLVTHGRLNSDVLWDDFRAWVDGANDVGTITRLALSSEHHDGAAESAHRQLGRSAGNGALMRATPLALAFLDAGTKELMDAAVKQGSLTHADPAAGWGAAIYAELVRRAILSADPLAEIDDVLLHVPDEVRSRFEMMLAASWTPHGPDVLSNGTVWGCLSQAIWAVRNTVSFHDAVVAAVTLGDDADTVACVTGGLAGAVYSMQGIPSRWTAYLHGVVNTDEGLRRYDNADLQDLARRLLGLGRVPETATELPAGPTEVAPGLWAADLLGASTVPSDWAVVSLCRTGGRFVNHPIRREVFLIDREDANCSLDEVILDAVDTINAFRAEGRDVVIHCHGGKSRTGLVLRAWAMRTNGLSERDAHEWMTKRWHRYADYNESFREALSGLDPPRR